MLRGFFLTVLASTLPALAFAQSGPGTIYFRSGEATYRIAGDGTNVAAVANPPAPLLACPPSARSDYPGGRLFFYDVERGQIPSLATPGLNYAYGDLHAWNESGVDKQLTNFHGPQYVIAWGNRTRLWSNDGRDSFFSFYVYDETTALYYVYRANVSADEITDPLVPFEPLVPGDSRLQPVIATATQLNDYAWDRSGAMIHYIDVFAIGGVNHYQIRTHIVGLDLKQANDPVLLDAGMPSRGGTVKSLSVLDASPTADLLVARVSDNGRGGTSGLITVDSSTGAWSWLLTDATASNSGVSPPGTPRFSPDGTGIAFSANRA